MLKGVSPDTFFRQPQSGGEKLKQLFEVMNSKYPTDWLSSSLLIQSKLMYNQHLLSPSGTRLFVPLQMPLSKDYKHSTPWVNPLCRFSHRNLPSHSLHAPRLSSCVPPKIFLLIKTEIYFGFSHRQTWDCVDQQALFFFQSLLVRWCIEGFYGLPKVPTV